MGADDNGARPSMVDEARDHANILLNHSTRLAHIEEKLNATHDLARATLAILHEMQGHETKVSESGQHMVPVDPNVILDQRELALKRRAEDRLTELKYKLVGGLAIALITAVLMHFLHL
jgi:hypothetical protein